MSDIHIHQLSLQEIINGCIRETRLFRTGQNGEQGYCIEILRRAIDQNDQDAWEAFYQQYKGLISRWAGSDQNTDDLLQLVFEKFFKMVKTRKFVLNESIAEALYYIKRCSISVRMNHLRVEQKQKLKNSLEDSIRDEFAPESGSIEEFFESNSLSSQDRGLDDDIALKETLEQLILWFDNHLQNIQERLVVTLSFESGLSPQEIAENYKNQFSNVAEVRKIKERILLRLHRSEEYKTLRKDW